MTVDGIAKKSKRAARWSLVTEIAVKLISPVSQIVLARLLAPQAFGMVATVTMVVNFADMFSDAGFQKYLVQHSFADDDELYRNANVAFWTNMTVSVFLWLLIAVYREPIATFVGNPSLGIPLAVAALSLPLTSFSSIQIALFHRHLDFKSIMPARIGSSGLTFAVTLILAFSGMDYWSLIAGTLSGNLINAIALTIQSKWKPRLQYSVHLLGEMLSFSGWTLLESLTIWLSTWAGTFIVGNSLGATELGLYKTPITFVGGCFAIVTNATTPILFSALSRLQDDHDAYLEYLYRFQFIIGLVLLPLSAGIFVFRDELVLFLLGNEWKDSALMFGLYGLLQGPMVLFSYYCSEMYRSLGKPKVSTLVQIIFMSAMIPTMIIAAQKNYETVVYADAITRLTLIVINQVVSHIIVGTSFWLMLSSVKESAFAALAMSAFAVFARRIIAMDFIRFSVVVLCCMILYLFICILFPRPRIFATNLLKDVFTTSEEKP